MDGRLKMTLVLVGLGLFTGAGPRTQNFIVDSPDPEFSAQVAQAAEEYRRTLALEWLGRELPPWQQPCPIRVVFEPQAHGATSFRFSGPTGESGQPFDWQMEVYGTPERILDSVLPHEITHTIFASHFKQRLPRWLDEGACSSVEHFSEIRKQEHNLLVFLTSGKGIPFNRMVRMMEYPPEMLPLYAQGYSVVRFMLEIDSKPHFVNFVRQGLQTQDWDGAVKDFYGFQDLSDLQVTWNQWVGDGSPGLQEVGDAIAKYVPRYRAMVSAPKAAPSVGASVPPSPRSQGEPELLGPTRGSGKSGGLTTESLWENDPYFSKSRYATRKQTTSSQAQPAPRRNYDAPPTTRDTILR